MTDLNFRYWLMERCVSRKTHTDWISLTYLHRDCNTWAAQHKMEPCTCAQCERWLEDAGHRVVDGGITHLALASELLNAQNQPLVWFAAELGEVEGIV